MFHRRRMCPGHLSKHSLYLIVVVGVNLRMPTTSHGKCSQGWIVFHVFQTIQAAPHSGGAKKKFWKNLEICFFHILFTCPVSYTKTSYKSGLTMGLTTQLRPKPPLIWVESLVPHRRRGIQLLPLAENTPAMGRWGDGEMGMGYLENLHE